LSRVNHATHVEAPVFNIDAITSLINGALDEELEELWQGGTGLCTSWSVAVANHDNNNNQFVFADRGEHRCCFDVNFFLAD
jgi:hypothetical protein